MKSRTNHGRDVGKHFKPEKMKKIILSAIVSLLISNANAQKDTIYYDSGGIEMIGSQDSNEKKTGRWMHFYSNGRIKSAGNYLNGKKTGEWTVFYEVGGFEYIENYTDGEKNGDYKIYYKNHQLEGIGSYLNDKKTGNWKYYHRINGRTESKGNFLDAKKTGEWRYYNTNEKLDAIANYSQGELAGKYGSYYPSGQLKSTGNYLSGGKTKEWVDYHYNGRIKSRGNYSKGEKQGKWKYYEEDEPIDEAEQSELLFKDSYSRLKETLFIEDDDDGEQKTYYDNGTVKSTGYLDENGEKTGEWKTYHENGQTFKTELFKDGKLMDIISYFDKDGYNLGRGSFRNGNGVLYEYDKDGTFIKTIIYLDGLPSED